MAKFYGDVAYAFTEKTAPGVWTENYIIRKYYGDVGSIRENTITPSETLNDNIKINNQISIVADAFAYANFYALRWVEWSGQKWRISNVEVKHPRLYLTLGGVYNEQES